VGNAGFDCWRSANPRRHGCFDADQRTLAANQVVAGATFCNTVVRAELVGALRHHEPFPPANDSVSRCTLMQNLASEEKETDSELFGIKVDN